MIAVQLSTLALLFFLTLALIVGLVLGVFAIALEDTLRERPQRFRGGYQPGGKPMDEWRQP